MYSIEVDQNLITLIMKLIPVHINIPNRSIAYWTVVVCFVTSTIFVHISSTAFTTTHCFFDIALVGREAVGGLPGNVPGNVVCDC